MPPILNRLSVDDGQRRVDNETRASRILDTNEQRITGGIRAETDVEVYLIPKEALAKLEEEHPKALLHFHRELLKNAVERMQVLTSELILLEER